jgi:hypothetical protein
MDGSGVGRPRLKPREQGDIGERSAVEWLWSQGAAVFVPFGHSPDYDLVGDLGDGALRIQVKTCTRRTPAGNWGVMLCTRGLSGNQSWSGVAKYFAADRCDALFVLVGDGRRWFIPSDAVEGRAGICLGGTKYAEYEVEGGRPILVPAGP